MCGKGLKIFCMASALLLLALLPTYSLDEEEAQELTQILTELNSGLNKVQSGLSEIENGQEKLSTELTKVKSKAKELEAESIQQKKALLRLEGQLQNLETSYSEIERDNRRLKWIAGGFAGTTIIALFVAVF